MADQLRQTVALETQPDEGELHAERLPLQSPSMELIGGGDVLRGLQIANALWFLVNGDRRER